MNRPTTSIPAAPTRLLRRIVLGTAFLLGLAVALAPRTPEVQAQEPATAPATAAKPAAKSLTITDGRGAEIKIDLADKARAGTPGEAPPGGATDAPPGTAAPSATTVDGAGNDAAGRGDATRKKRARVTIDGLGTDHEFDSFDDFAKNKPALAAMVVAIVAVVFFAPVVAIALILWYRMRKARMLNETMLKLAERGVVPSSEALDALAGGRPPAAVAPYYEQAKQIRRRAAWSDLRKGVLMGGFGLALSAYSLLADQEPNGLGLVLLFVGLGFVLLWWFEERHLTPSNRATPDASVGSGRRQCARKSAAGLTAARCAFEPGPPAINPSDGGVVSHRCRTRRTRRRPG